MTDFFREVDEDYRRDRVIKTLSRYQVPLAVLIVLIIAGTAGYNIWSSQRQAAAEAVNSRYMAAQELAKAGKTQEALTDFRKLGTDAPTGYATLARFQTAGLVGVKEAEAGAKAFDAIANDDKVPTSMRDAARLRGAMLRIDIDDPKAFESHYRPFSQPTFAYHASMRELLALAAMKRGDYPAAGRFLDEIISDLQAPEGVRFRAQAFRELVNGGDAQTMSMPPAAAAVTPVGQVTPPSAPAPPNSAPSTPAPKPSPAAKPSTPAPSPH